MSDLFGEEAVRDAVLAGAARPPDPVHVVLDRQGEAEVYHHLGEGEGRKRRARRRRTKSVGVGGGHSGPFQGVTLQVLENLSAYFR